MYPNAEQLPLIIKLQPFFKEKMGDVTSKEVTWISETQRLITPLAIDPECSERCLWGMLEGYKSLNSGTPAILCVKRNGIADAIAYQSDNPYTALLKALITQEGL